MKLRLPLLLLMLFAPLVAQDAPKRPRITGISHAAFYVSDMAKARAFYEDFLGFQSPFSIPRKDPKEQLVWIKINDRQSVELFPGSEVSPEADRLYHIAIETDDAEGMRLYLQAKGVAVPPKTAIGKIGNKNYFVKDPNGNTVEIVEYLPDGWTMREKGKFMSDRRISTRMSHVGVMVGQLDLSMKFYGEILGFQETWRGGAGATLSWVNLRVPDGEDYVEFMLYAKAPTRDVLLTKHHICLEVEDVAKAGAILASRTLPEGSKPPDTMKTGVNGKRQINYFDPDGTRIEIMEPRTFDGKPVPPSTAPAPAPLPPYQPSVGAPPATRK
ncbi:MAG: VOC family protein [Opitutaceae bacterium]|nr:VOC family protein [Opitutaceae bacterium]